ncbi:MAG: NIPSNAP family protein [Actinomycetia bacterium]|nr:NIPSNAP family protein [Actinomycetes bacterium]
MVVYEKRTYDIKVGHMADITRLYSEEGWAVIEKGGFGDYLVGYFTSDTGPLNQLIHIWRFVDDADRRAFWARLFADEAFMKFAAQIRDHIDQQNVQLLNPAPWGPTP